MLKGVYFWFSVFQRFFLLSDCFFIEFECTRHHIDIITIFTIIDFICYWMILNIRLDNWDWRNLFSVHQKFEKFWAWLEPTLVPTHSEKNHWLRIIILLRSLKQFIKCLNTVYSPIIRVFDLEKWFCYLNDIEFIRIFSKNGW